MFSPTGVAAEWERIDQARDDVLAKGYRISFAYQGAGVSQIILESISASAT